MAAKLQLNGLKQLMTEAQKDIDNSKYFQKFKNEPIFAKLMRLVFPGGRFSRSDRGRLPVNQPIVAG